MPIRPKCYARDTATRMRLAAKDRSIHRDTSIDMRMKGHCNAYTIERAISIVNNFNLLGSMEEHDNRQSVSVCYTDSVYSHKKTCHLQCNHGIMLARR